MREVNLSMTRGDSRQYIIDVVDEKGVAVDVTGALINFRLAKDKTKPVDLLLVNGAQVGVVDGVLGQLSIRLTTADTDPLLGDYFYEIELMFPFGGNSTVLYGVHTFLQDIRETP